MYRCVQQISKYTTAMFFETYILASYNINVGNSLLVECEKGCYEKYRHQFDEHIIHQRQSYMGCLPYTSSTRTRIAHGSVPIMLGSYMDFLIRGRKAVLESRALWGLVILRGQLKIYDNFSTFDALSMHVHQTKNSHAINWFTYIKSDGLALNYQNRVVRCTYQQKVTDNTTEPDVWIDLLRESCPYKENVYADEYLQMFNTILSHPYSMNDLKIRQILNGPKIIRKYIQSDLQRRKRQTSGHQKLVIAFESGALFQVLSKKNAFHMDEWHKNYTQSYDSTMHDGRSNKTAHFLPTISRASNAAIRNSSALTFPPDACNYFCMLNTKDLKSAGEQNILADFVIMTEETCPFELYNYLKGLVINEMTSININDQHAVKNTTTNNTEIEVMKLASLPPQSPITNDSELAIMTINGYLIHVSCKWTLEDLVRCKQKFPHVTTQYSWPYVRFSTRDCIPIKYSDKYDCFFSPAETVFFNITYPPRDMLSITAKELSWLPLCKTPPAKATVSINNIKGSIAKVTSELHRKLMQNSLGITCYMDMSQNDLEHLIDYAVIDTNQDTTYFHKVYRDIVEEFKIDYDEERKCLIPPKVEETNVRKALNALRRMYPSDRYSDTCINTNLNQPLNREKYDQEYNDKIIYAEENYKTPNIWNLRLRAAFGNPFGGCIEDGVVIDENILPHIKPIHYNACFTIEFTFKTIKQPKSSRFIAVNDEHHRKFLNTHLGERGKDMRETLIGCLISPFQAYAKRSKHSQVIQCKLGDHFYYLIHFLPKRTGMYENLNVSHIRQSNVITVVIKGETKVKFGIGSKIANSFGQKNIVSMTTNRLRDTCWGITRDGRKVHAQLIYSDVSMVSRLLSGQLYDMLTSNELALGPDNTIIAPVDLIIHTLHPYTNIKVFDIKVDTLTNMNGFDSQNLCGVSSYLRSELVDGKVLKVIEMLGYSIKTNVERRCMPILGTIPVTTSMRRNDSTDNLVAVNDPKTQSIDDKSDVYNKTYANDCSGDDKPISKNSNDGNGNANKGYIFEQYNAADDDDTDELTDDGYDENFEKILAPKRMRFN